MTTFFQPNKLFFFLLLIFLFSNSANAIVSTQYHTFDLSNSYGIGFEPQALFWTTSRAGATKVQLCGSNYYLGGKDVFQSVGDYMERTYKVVPSHNTVRFYMKILLVDQWTVNDRVSILLNNYEIGFTSNKWNIHNSGNYQCGTSNYADLELTSYGYVPHTGSSLTLKIINRRVSPNWNGTILISDINLLFSTISGPSQYTFIYPVPFISGSSNPTCRFKTYYDSSYGCRNCHVSCDYCWGPSNTQCFKCNATTYWDGGACISCDPTCRICHGTLATQCDYCTGSRYLIDSQCVSCDAPFIRTTQYFGQCIYPCKAGEFLYSDGSCYTTCDPRFTSTTKYNKAVCNFPCSSSNTRYYNSVCSSLVCPYPLQMIRYGSYYICEYPCATGLLLYADGSCQNPALCVYPLILHTYTAYASWQACGSVCAFGFYRYNNDTCHAKCPAPLIAKDINGILICDPPRCGPNQCNSCTSWNTCLDYYTCNVNLGSWCMFQHTYSLIIKTLKRNVMNGVSFSVTVTPLMGIGEFNDDELKPEIDGLIKGEDYEVTVKKIGTGNFEVTFVFTTNLDESKYNGTMYYSPAILALEQDFKFPHITFISEEVQEAANNISATSQITFILFLISVFGMIFGGGIASLWTSVPESQYTYYLIYLNINYLHHTTLYFRSLSSYDILAGDNTGPQLDIELKNSLPSKFFDLDYSPDFYENTDQVFLQLVFMVSGLFLGTLSLRFLRFPKDLSFIQKIFSYILGIVKWNGLIRQFMTYILPFSTPAFVQIYAAVFGQVKQNLFSLIIAPATMVVVVWFLALTRNLIAYIPNEKYQKISHQRFFGTLWENLRVGSIGKYYFWFGAIRNIVLAYVAVFFDFSPSLQIITLIIYQSLMVILYFQKSDNFIGIGLRPIFEDKALTIITLVQDILLLIMKTMIFTFLHNQGTAKDSTLILLGWMIILPGILSQVVQTGFSILNQVRNRQKIWRKFRVLFHKMSMQKKKKRIKRVKSIKPFRKTSHQALNTENQNETQGTQRDEPLPS